MDRVTLTNIHPPDLGDPGWGGQTSDGNTVELWGIDPAVAAHETFHILGIDHANGLRCTLAGSPVAIADDCTSAPYGDPFDIQGNNGYHHPNAYFKARLGWFMVSNLFTVPKNRNQTLTLHINPIERASNGLLAVRIPIPRSRIPLQYPWGADPTTVDLFYYLEYRQPSPFDAFSAADPVVNGVSIHLGTDIDTNHMTMLVDTHPETPGFRDAALAAGQTFSDPVAGITIRTISATSIDAIVEVTVAAGETASQGPHLLWSRTDGTGSLWTVDSAGNYISHRYYGPIPNLTAMDYQRFTPGFFCVFVPSCTSAKMLWARNDGLAIIWNLDGNDNIVSIKRYGPFADWTPRSYQKLPDGTARLLWSRTDGTANIWTLDSMDGYVSTKLIGPYPTWTAKSYQRLSDGTARLLWTRSDGLASIWTLNGSDDYIRNTDYGPFVNWTANGYEKLADGTSRLVWARTDGLGSIWTLNSTDGYVSYLYQGPFVDWTAHAFTNQ